MAQIPTMGTLGRIDLALKNNRKQRVKKCLSCSMIGDDCDRKTWFEFYHPKPVEDPVLLRKFDMGDLIERYVISILKLSGHMVYDKDENGEQFKVAFGNFLSGSCDGIIVGLSESDKPHLLEIKSAKNSSFNQVKKNGVQQTYPQYYTQVQTYMLGLDLERCLFVMMNKDTQEIYIERIKFDKFAAMMALEKAESIFKNPKLKPERFYNKSTHYKCSMCRYKKECWNEDN